MSKNGPVLSPPGVYIHRTLQETINTYRRQVAAAIERVRLATGVGLSLAELSAAAGSSPFHFDRVFRRMTGMGAVRYVRWLRLREAAVQLVQSNRRVIDIGLAAGYANHESFSRAFRQEFKWSPRDYRRRNKSVGKNSKEISMKTLGITFGFVKIPVSDFAKATAFYGDVLGLEEDFAVEQYGWAQYSAGTASICVYVAGMGGGNGKPGVDTGIQLRVSDAKAAHALIGSRGGNVSTLKTGDDGSAGFDVTDTDGNLITITQVPVESPE